MLRDLQRFYREAPRDLEALEQIHTTLGDYLEAGAYGAAFRNDHLLPMAAAIWSAPARQILDYPAAAFIRFHDNHGLLKLRNRPPWRTVWGGSRAYVERLTQSYKNRIRLGTPAVAITRDNGSVKIRDNSGAIESFDDVVIASHADQALGLLGDASPEERRLLGAFRYSRNVAVLHSDARLMPRRRAVWSSWNYTGDSGDECPSVTYWMNSLQNIPHATPLFVTLNPHFRRAREHHREIYEHPLFDAAAIAAQRQLWSLQGDAQHLVLRRLFRRGLSRRRFAGGPRGRRNARRRPAALAGGKRIRPYRARSAACNAAATGARRMILRSTLYTGVVMHRRLRPRPHRLRYRVFWMLLDLDEIDRLPRRLHLFSHNRFNAVSFYDADHGDGSGRPLRAQVERHLKTAGIDLEGGSIRLLCMPRVFGYGFNPLSVYFCHRNDGSLAALLYEVHNTFKQRHSYLIPVAAHADIVDQQCRKNFYVSPFMDMDMSYRFRVAVPGDRVGVAISAADRDGPLLTAALNGRRRALTDSSLLRLLLTYPLLTLKVIGAIHWHAARLLLKGARLQPRPAAPPEPVTHVGATGR